ncbi:RibD family protein [Chroococcidiopsis sp. FACHB-1243]|nr:RibD family protein [Chroococcidiopsis sp. [FACHB-1243]]MBD2309218.1 RibD family protein [Chroococcidiopsis sp. [FACHB-1243]]
MSADGKIADARRSPARFSSQRDRFHLEQQIAAADATLFGAGTLRAYGTTLSVTSAKLLHQRLQNHQKSQPIQILASASAKIDPQWRFFRQPVPRWLLTSAAGAKSWQGRSEFEKVIVGEQGVGDKIQNSKFKIQNGDKEDKGDKGDKRDKGDKEAEEQRRTKPHSPLTTHHPTTNYQLPTIDWTFALEQLFSLGIKRLAVLGGGELVAAMLAVDLIDEMWLTVCPLLLGGTNAPSPVAGMGFPENLAPRLELLSAQVEAQEVFLHYRLQRSQ